jgi:hypothetical protein
MSAREGLFARAATFHGKSRERITAIGVADQLFSRLYPDHDRIERITKVEGIWDKASEQRRQQFIRRDGNCISIIMGIIRDGVASGDLVIPEHLTEAGLMYGLWSTAIGGRIIITHGLASEVLGDQDPEAAMMVNHQVLLDGYGWRPLSTEWNYAETAERIRQEVFADDLKRIHA